jgi:hypothetical protein
MGSAGLGVPAAVVILVLMFGATIFLWQARYIRRSTAFALMAALAIVLIVLGVWSYSHPM